MPKRFTVVFEGDLDAIQDPFHVASRFGKPVANR